MPKTLAPVIVFVDIDAAPASRGEPRDGPAVTGPAKEPASPPLAGLLETLAGERISLILCSRRTRAEVERARQALGIFHPFVCENGAAAFVPERYFGSDLPDARRVGGYQAIEFGWPYEQVVEVLNRVAGRMNLRIQRFGGMSVEQVARECDVSLLDARLAKLREYGEPFRLLSPNPVAEERLLHALEHAGLTCVAHRSFLHAGSVPGAGSAVAVLTALYRETFGSIVTLALGEGASSADIGRRVDVLLPTSGPDAPACAGPADWMQRIVRDANNARAARLSWPAVRHAR